VVSWPDTQRFVARSQWFHAPIRAWAFFSLNLTFRVAIVRLSIFFILLAGIDFACTVDGRYNAWIKRQS